MRCTYELIIGARDVPRFLHISTIQIMLEDNLQLLSNEFKVKSQHTENKLEPKRAGAISKYSDIRSKIETKKTFMIKYE